jgi:uncharacterized Zn-binding protein involved in type VI secretion
MPAVQRVGDANDVGGVVQGGIASVRVNGKPISVLGDSVTPHPPCGQRKAPPIHCTASVSGGSGSVRAGGIPVDYTGVADTCGHTRAGGSDNVRVAA